MNTQKLKELAESLSGEQWAYHRNSPYSRGYITGSGGRTIVQTSDGEVPANVCRFIEAFDPATAIKLIKQLEAADRDRDELRAMAAEVSECRRFVAEELGPESGIQFAALSTERSDEVIREIRAQAVESYANYSDECYGTHDKSGEDARIYAARIRSGEQP